MKLTDITVGERYAAHDEPTSKYNRILPREVEVLEVVTEEEKQWQRYTSEFKVTKKKKLKVKFISEPTYPNGGYRFSIASAPVGAERVVEARFLVAPWAHLRDDVKRTLEEKAEQEAAEKALEERVLRLVKAGATRKERRKEFMVLPDVRRYGGKLYEELRVEGEAVDWLLTLAEAGLAARGS